LFGGRLSLVSNIDKRRVVARFVEFFFLGLVMGIVEDILAIYFATDAEITFDTFVVATLVALPFAVLTEFLADLKLFRKVLGVKKRV
jgi:hypothetical protein